MALLSSNRATKISSTKNLIIKLNGILGIKVLHSCRLSHLIFSRRSTNGRFAHPSTFDYDKYSQRIVIFKAAAFNISRWSQSAETPQPLKSWKQGMEWWCDSRFDSGFDVEKIGRCSRKSERTIDAGYSRNSKCLQFLWQYPVDRLKIVNIVPVVI